MALPVYTYHMSCSTAIYFRNIGDWNRSLSVYLFVVCVSSFLQMLDKRWISFEQVTVGFSAVRVSIGLNMVSGSLTSVPFTARLSVSSASFGRPLFSNQGILSGDILQRLNKFNSIQFNEVFFGKSHINSPLKIL